MTTTKVEITRESFSAALDAAVEERGAEFVYPYEWRVLVSADDPNRNTTCQYALKDGTPACIVGLALSKLGVDVSQLENTDATTILYSLGVDDVGLQSAAADAQESQDGGHTWGAARERYLATLASFANEDDDALRDRERGDYESDFI